MTIQQAYGSRWDVAGLLRVKEQGSVLIWGVPSKIEYTFKNWGSQTKADSLWKWMCLLDFLHYGGGIHLGGFNVLMFYFRYKVRYLSFVISSVYILV